jgi:protein-disulfide isomerase
VEFSDYQCPACKRGWADAKKVLQRMGDKIRHGLVNYPLVQNHPWAFRASVAGVCVGQQSEALVMELKEEMYRLQSTLTPSSVDDAAFAFVAQRGLDDAAFRACYLKDPAVEQVLAEMIVLSDVDAAVARMNAILAAGGIPERAAAPPRR